MIAVRDDGTPWESEKEMQTRVSHYLRDLERDGLIGAGTTLHGLRVSYAAWWKRDGATDAEVADLLGDKSQRMGTHYTRPRHARGQRHPRFQAGEGSRNVNCVTRGPACITFARGHRIL